MCIKEHTDAYQSEIAREFGCSQKTVCKALKKSKITQKKATFYNKQNQEEVNKHLEEILDISKEVIAYVDETRVDTYIYREYRYAPKGMLVFDHNKRTQI